MGEAPGSGVRSTFGGTTAAADIESRKVGRGKRQPGISYLLPKQQQQEDEEQDQEEEAEEEEEEEEQQQELQRVGGVLVKSQLQRQGDLFAKQGNPFMLFNAAGADATL